MFYEGWFKDGHELNNKVTGSSPSVESRLRYDGIDGFRRHLDSTVSKLPSVTKSIYRDPLVVPSRFINSGTWLNLTNGSPVSGILDFP